MAERKKTAVKKTAARKPTAARKTAAKKSGAKKAAPAKTVKTKKLGAEIKGIFLIALGVFIGISFFTGATGVVGEFFKDVLMGLFGGAAGIFFIFVIWTGVNMFMERKNSGASYKVWVLLALMVVTSVLWAIWYQDTAWRYDDFVSGIRSMYAYGVDGCSGGIIGVCLTVLLVKCLGVVGTTLIFVALGLILLMILTELSFEKIFKAIAKAWRENKEKMAESLNEEIEVDPAEEDYAESDENAGEAEPVRPKRRGSGKKTAAETVVTEAAETNSAAMPNNGYFDLYFKADAIEGLAEDKQAAEPPGEKGGKAIKRFVFEEDDEEETRSLIAPETESGDLGAESGAAANGSAAGSGEMSGGTAYGGIAYGSTAYGSDSHGSDAAHKAANAAAGAAGASDEFAAAGGFGADGASAEDMPFKIEDIHTGVLTSLPDESGNFKEESDEFEPPSLVQMNERVDPMTQSAIDAGVPLDRAVSAGKRIKHEEAEAAADSINAMAKESIEATRIINYRLPSVKLLAKPAVKAKSRGEVKRELEDKANRLLETLASFKVDAKILNITQGPTVTRFELQPGFGIKVSKITNLADDIALSLAASGVRIEAPIPGKAAIGIEIPNETATAVPIREVIDTDKFRDFKSKTAFALGKDISGSCIVADVAQFPHVLIAGATGSGKSVCINSLVTSILYKAKPNEVKLIMIDPKKVELGVYNGIPHLLIPVVTDPRHAAGALNWAVAEMKNRYQLLEDNKVRNIQGFNKLMEESGTPENKLPEIVIIIDELADLMLAAKSEVEDSINSLAALARAAGMYLVIATQRPSVDVITGVIKANVPSRIAFAVSSYIDSRTILDTHGAEKLLGKGDMLYSPRGAIKPMRIQGNFVSDAEIENIVEFVKKQYTAEYDEAIIEHIERDAEETESGGGDDDSHMRGGERDELFFKAAELAIDSNQASVAMLQRRFKVGYQRAARIIDQMEEYRVIGPYEGTKPRQVLMSRAELNEMLMHSGE